jgi:hypothetical protein
MSQFIRFQTTIAGDHAHWPIGIFRAANRLRAVEHELLACWFEEGYEWFNANLAAPELRDLDLRAVFWFRHDARTHIAEAWSLAAAFREAGLGVSIQRTSTPGRILYRDPHQVAAIPYWRFGRGPIRWSRKSGERRTFAQRRCGL